MSYYTFTPGQVYGQALGQVDASAFNAAGVWADVQRSNECYSPSGTHYQKCKDDPSSRECGQCNFYGGRATRQIQTALAALGYNPGKIDGQYGTRTRAAWVKFTSDQNVPAGTLVSKEGIFALEARLQGKTAKAGMFGWGLLAVLAVGGAAVYAVATSDKKEGDTTALALRA